MRLFRHLLTVLEYLIEHRDRIVTKDELLDHIWPEQYVSEATLSHRLMTARKAIGDSGRRQRYIKTIHGRGYRFIGAIEERSTDPIPQSEVGGASPMPMPPEGVSRAAPDVGSARMGSGSHLEGWAALPPSRSQRASEPCTSCQPFNADEDPFSAACEASFDWRCSWCGQASPESAAFCSACGHRLVSEASSEMASVAMTQPTDTPLLTTILLVYWLPSI